MRVSLQLYGWKLCLHLYGSKGFESERAIIRRKRQKVNGAKGETRKWTYYQVIRESEGRETADTDPESQQDVEAVRGEI